VFDTARSAPPEEIGSPDFDPGKGPQWSTYQPEGLLADMLERESGEGSQWERLERIGAWERIVAWAQANRTVRFTRYTVLVSVTSPARVLRGPKGFICSSRESARAPKWAAKIS
jgi:hypothetical protein